MAVTVERRVDPVLEARAVSFAYDGDPVVHGVDLEVPAGCVSAIVGANGSGKSTLLRGLARVLRPDGGVVLLDGHDIRRLPTRRVATRLGLLPQEPRAPEGITVADLVERGRTPHRGLFSRSSGADRDAVMRALALTGTGELAHRRVDSLSGGQRQRVWIAMAVAQEPGILLLDEPTSFLDVAHQLDVLDLIAGLNRTDATTVVMVLHELNLAARYADHLVVMRAGRVHAAGPPEQVLTPAVLRAAFGLDALVLSDPVSERPLVVPVGRVAPEPA